MKAAASTKVRSLRHFAIRAEHQAISPESRDRSELRTSGEAARGRLSRSTGQVISRVRDGPRFALPAKPFAPPASRLHLRRSRPFQRSHRKMPTEGTVKIHTLKLAVIVGMAILVAACGGAPAESGLRDSFAEQMAANTFIKDFQRSGDDLTFIGPGAEGGVAKWRVHIDSTVVEPNDDPQQPYKGTVKSSWYSNDQLVRPRGRESNLPIELMATELAQECWAFWR